MKNTGLKYRFIKRIVLGTLLATILLNNSGAQHYGYNYNIWAGDHGANGLWDFSYDPPRIKRWIEYEDIFRTYYFSFMTAGCVINDSTGHYLFTASDGITNTDTVLLSLSSNLSDTIFRVPDFQGLLSMKDPGQPSFAMTSFNPYTVFMHYRQNKHGTVNQVDIDSVQALPVAAPPHYIYHKKIRNMHHFPDKDTVWLYFQLQPRYDKREIRVAESDTIFISSYHAQKFKAHAQLAFNLPKVTTLPLPHYLSAKGQVVQVSPDGNSLLYCVDYINQTWTSSESKSFLLLIQLKKGLHEIKKVSVLDSFYMSPFFKGERLLLTNYTAFSPNGTFVYTSVVHNTTYWIGKKGNSHDKFHIKIWRYDIRTGEKQEVRLDNSNDTILAYKGNHQTVLVPNGQIYVTGQLDTFRKKIGVWKITTYRNFLAKIRFPDKPIDSVGFVLSDVEIVQPAHRKYDYLPDLYFYPQPTVPRINYTVNTTCQDGKVHIRNKSPDFFTQFKWYILSCPDSAVIDSFTGKNPTFGLPASGDYFIRASGKTETGFTNWRWDYFGYIKKPVALFDTSITQGCQWAKVSFTDQSVADTSTSAGKSWQWYFYKNGSLLLSSTKQNPNITFSQPGVYSVKLVFSNGFCSDTLYKRNLIKINQAPKAGFSISDTFICAPDTVYFTNKSSGEFRRLEYIWNDGLLLQNENNLRFFDTTGTFTLVQKLYANNGCISKDSVTIKVTQGVSASFKPVMHYVSFSEPDSLKIRYADVSWARDLVIEELYNSQKTLDTLTSRSGLLYRQSVTPIEQSYYYKLRAIDSCGRLSAPSNIVSSIFLTAENNNDRWVVLNWNTPLTYTKNPGPFSIQNYENGKWKNVTSTTDTFNNLAINPEEGKTYTYRISATYNSDTMQAVLTSNPVEIKAETFVFIPNSFSPNGDGINDIFAIGTFGVDSFSATIFSRWGQVLGISHNPLEVWDGIDSQGENVPLGTYYYIMNFRSSAGQEFTRTGIINLIR
ncbi:T9SS type B sorting domain-containing protein [bacterium]|nr:T9SS type B sorting domain-containing protein [bacterium]